MTFIPEPHWPDGSDDRSAAPEGDESVHYWNDRTRRGAYYRPRVDNPAHGPGPGCHWCRVELWGQNKWQVHFNWGRPGGVTRRVFACASCAEAYAWGRLHG